MAVSDEISPLAFPDMWAALAAGFRRTHRQGPFVAGSVLEHVGPRSVVLGTPHRRLTYVTLDHDGLMPGGLSVTPDGFEALRQSLAATALGKQIPSWLGSLELPPRTDLSLTSRAVDPGQVALLVRGLSGLPSARTGLPGDPEVRLLAGQLVQSLARAGSRERALATLIGVGAGTTPAGDDLIVGVMAGLILTGRTRDHAVVSRLLPPLLPRTTRASRHFLGWAMRGQFATPVLRLCEALGGTADLTTAMTRLRRWGASSGVDLMHGLAAALADRRSGGSDLPINDLGRAS